MLFAAAMAIGFTQTQQRVNVWAYGCDFSTTRAVQIFAQNRMLFGAGGRTITANAHSGENGRLTFSFTLPAGSFYMSYTAIGQKCGSSGEGLTILPAHNRHIVVSMQPGMWARDWHARRFFAGTLPDVGLAVSVVVSTNANCPIDEDMHNAPAREYPATIDGNAYYVGYVSGTHAFLRIRSAAFDVLYLALPDEAAPRYNDQYVIRNITENDLRRLATHTNPNRPECVLVPSGVSAGFEQ
jgi:hypothetical protein